MKIRNGFVSNSSSSSFVILGFTVPHGKYSKQEYLEKLYDVTSWKDEDDMEDMFYDHAHSKTFYVANHEEDGAPKGKDLIGTLMVTWDSEEYTKTAEYDSAALQTKAMEARDKLGLSEAEAPIKLYVGTRIL